MNIPLEILNQTTIVVLKQMDDSNILTLARRIAMHDPRINRCKKHRAETIVFITLCAVMCGKRT